MKYTIQFLTDKGAEAYRDIKGAKTSIKERMVVNRIFREKVVKEDPLTVEINCLIPWLAVQERIDEKIIQQMGNRLCERDLDYTIEVS